MHSLHSTPTLTMSQKPSAELLPFKISTPCVSLAASKTYSTNLKCQLHPSSQNFDDLGSRIPAKDSTLQQACVFSHHGFAEWKWKTDQRGAATEGLPGAWQKVHISSWGTCFFFCQCSHATLEKILGYLQFVVDHFSTLQCISLHILLLFLKSGIFTSWSSWRFAKQERILKEFLKDVASPDRSDLSPP